MECVVQRVHKAELRNGRVLLLAEVDRTHLELLHADRDLPRPKGRPGRELLTLVLKITHPDGTQKEVHGTLGTADPLDSPGEFGFNLQEIGEIPAGSRIEMARYEVSPTAENDS